MAVNINIHHHYHQPEKSKTDRLILKKLKQIMASIQELSAEVTNLQTALDAEQEQVRLAIEALDEQIAVLRGMLADGGTAEERQALMEQIQSIRGDLENTIADAPTEPSEPTDPTEPEA
jgi:hypothetical protein